MTIAVRIDNQDPTPPYEQLRRQLAEAILTGQLEAGSRLPTVRQLAGDLGLANGTVMRSYIELSTSGLVSTARGQGTTVLEVSHLSQTIKRQRLDKLATALMTEARLQGLSSQEVQQLLIDTMTELDSEKEAV